MKTYIRALTIAGSDSGGGAGIQADLKTFAANGAYGMSAITAVTAQNTTGVLDIHPVPVKIIEAQIKAVMEDVGADTVKIGMLHSTDVIRTVVRTLRSWPVPHIVLDPVMVATSGDKLLEDSAIEILIREMFPVVSLITPNIPEAEIILHQKIRNQPDLHKAAKELATLKAGTVLLKAGHLSGCTLTDILCIPGKEIIEIKSKRINTSNTHGTGCTLSSAIAVFLAKGYDMVHAVKAGIEYTQKAIESGAKYQTGNGYGPVHHFYGFWK